jgi:hypothetical protein
MIKAIKYSERSIAIYGDTKPIKEQLKAAGGKFNAFLTIEGRKQPGWIFSAKNAYAQATLSEFNEREADFSKLTAENWNDAQLVQAQEDAPFDRFAQENNL